MSAVAPTESRPAVVPCPPVARANVSANVAAASTAACASCDSNRDAPLLVVSLRSTFRSRVAGGAPRGACPAISMLGEAGAIGSASRVLARCE